jgi:hypothetical protein
MCRLGHVDVHEIVGKDRASHRGDSHDTPANSQIVDGLGDQTMDDAVGASGAIVGVDIREGSRF